eukprot:TRINITY_DN1106_c0_g1_i1.p1 TRINITY_DN1106_c0_g1~~TRINITY_DN1106_c0_g1_i1.p1  ORF type:complete len:604 (+),score=155.24 TRINITY_DN1106_c0_g1_i1:51-1862(+)
MNFKYKPKTIRPLRPNRSTTLSKSISKQKKNSNVKENENDLNLQITGISLTSRKNIQSKRPNTAPASNKSLNKRVNFEFETHDDNFKSHKISNRSLSVDSLDKKTFITKEKNSKEIFFDDIARNKRNLPQLQDIQADNQIIANLRKRYQLPGSSAIANVNSPNMLSPTSKISFHDRNRPKSAQSMRNYEDRDIFPHHQSQSHKFDTLQRYSPIKQHYNELKKVNFNKTLTSTRDFISVRMPGMQQQEFTEKYSMKKDNPKISQNIKVRIPSVQINHQTSPPYSALSSELSFEFENGKYNDESRENTILSENSNFYTEGDAYKTSTAKSYYNSLFDLNVTPNDKSENNTDCVTQEEENIENESIMTSSFVEIKETDKLDVDKNFQDVFFSDDKDHFASNDLHIDDVVDDIIYSNEIAIPQFNPTFEQQKTGTFDLNCNLESQNNKQIDAIPLFFEDDNEVNIFPFEISSDDLHPNSNFSSVIIPSEIEKSRTFVNDNHNVQSDTQDSSMSSTQILGSDFCSSPTNKNSLTNKIDEETLSTVEDLTVDLLNCAFNVDSNDMTLVSALLGVPITFDETSGNSDSIFSMAFDSLKTISELQREEQKK